MTSNGRISDVAPCDSTFDKNKIEAAKHLLRGLADQAPELVEAAGIDPSEWATYLRAGVESMRGSNAADSSEKKRFVGAVLELMKASGQVSEWSAVDTEGRSDYRVELASGTVVAVEAKGCPDGNNTTIWDRPSWADEFVVWSMCPHGTNSVGAGVWSGIATRLAPVAVAEHRRADAFIFSDASCGSGLRACPKRHGAQLQVSATGETQHVPPPCIYLMPRLNATVRSNPHPAVHSLETCRFARALLTAFEVPVDEQDRYVHEAQIGVKGTEAGTKVQVEIISRAWPDGSTRGYRGNWKNVRRDS